MTLEHASAPSPAPGRGTVAMQSELVQAAQELTNTIRRRGDSLLAILEQFAAGSEEKRKLVDQTHAPSVKQLIEKADGVARRNRSRPSVCVVGKRGAGKTTLLQCWLGPDSPTRGIDEMGHLPSGDSDTTASLVRLCLLDDLRDPADADFLHVTLFAANDYPVEEPSKRPPAPGCSSPIRVRKRSTTSASPADAYRVCRSPLDDKDANIKLRDDGAGYVIHKDGTIPLTAVQWHSRQVEIPLRPDDVHEQSHARRVLQAAAIVDAPGADSQATGEYQDWKLKKNSKVFETATRELDVLLLVSSCRTDAIQLGHQAQSDIWYPWVRRCEEQGAGRVLLAITRCSELFGEAESQLKRGDATKSNEELSFHRKLWKNLLEPLMATDQSKPLVVPDDPTTWPPIFSSTRRRKICRALPRASNPGRGRRWPGNW